MTLTPAPLFNDLADGPDGGVAHWLTTADGLRIRVGHWTTKQARGTVLLFPGRTEYIEKYGRDARALLAKGYATVVIDWRGQGLADRMTANRNYGHVDAFSDYQHDVQALIAHVRDLGLPEPFYLLAHSMGGCIGLRSLYNGLPVKAAAFSAPMWGIKMAPTVRAFAWVATTLGQALGAGKKLAMGQSEEGMMVSTPFEQNTLTTDAQMYAYMCDQVAAQPDLALGGPTLGWLNQALVEMRALAKRSSPDLPCVTFLGSDESIVDPDRIKERMAVWPKGTLEHLPKCKHEILMEHPQARAFAFDRIAALFDAHR